MMRKIIHYLHAVAALGLVLGAGLLAATPAKADHDHGPSFHFSFGFPPPPVVVVEPPPVYYYEPAPRVVIQHRPYYRAWHYHDRHHGKEWRHHRHHKRHHRHHRHHHD